jgi:hypothetical protein
MAVEEEEGVASRDREYARIASAMPFEGPIVYTIFTEARTVS